MAKVLKEIFSASDKINQTYTIHSWHVSQSVDALTGADDYDITISGSLTVTGSVYLEGTPNINSNANTVLVLDTSNNQVKYGPDISTFSGSTVDTGSLLTTASLSGTNLIFTKGDDSTFSITLPTGGDASTGSLLTTASIDGTNLVFTKGDGSTFSVSIPETQSLQDVTGIENRTSSSIQIGPGDPNEAITKDGLYYLDIGSNISGVSSNAGNSIYAGSKYNIINGSVNSIKGYASLISGLGNYSHTNTSSSIAVGSYNELGTTNYGAVVNAAAFGTIAYAYGDQSFAQGSNVEARGDNSHAQGSNTLASGTNSHAEGFQTTASNTRAHSEGYSTTASGIQSHAEGYNSTASGQSSHAEGETTTASGWGAHAEGSGSNASGSFSHAEGYKTSADQLSHAEGIHTIAWGVQTFPTTDRWATGPYNPIPGLSGSGQHLEGAQLVIGRYNEPKNDQLFIIGNGVSEEDRTNIMEVSLTDVNFYYPITSSADISSSGNLTINNLNVVTSFTASIISASSIIGDVTASAVGNNTEIQFNDGGIFGASPNLTWDKTTNVLTVKGGTTESYPSIFLTTTETVISTNSILGRLEAFNADESGESFNPGIVFKADKDWASPSTYNSRIEFKVVGDLPLETTQLLISSSGQIKFNSYGSGNFTGTPSKILATDSNGNIIETVNTNVIPEPGSFTSLNISDYFYKGLNEYDIQYTNGTDPTINGAVSVNNADPSLVTQLKISAKDDGGNTITSISKIVKGSVIYMKTSDDTPTVTYIAESNAVTGGSPTYTFYTINVRPQIIIGGDNWQGTDGLTEFQIDNPINETISTGYHKYEISYESNLAASFNSDLLVRFRCDQSNNIGDTTLIEYKGVSTNNDGGYSQYAQLQAQTISSSLEVNNNYSSFHNNFDTGSGFVTLMTVQSGSSKGFMILGNNQYV